MNDISLILKALEFAAQRHGTQLRKGKNKTPYINHPIQVASLLANEGGEKDTILLAAAILTPCQTQFFSCDIAAWLF